MIVCGKCGTKNADWVKKCNGCNHEFGRKIIIPATAVIKTREGSEPATALMNQSASTVFDGFIRITASISQNVYFVMTDTLAESNEYIGFVRKNEYLDVDVTSGSFQFKYALGGDEWLGEAGLFGPKTFKSVIESLLDIKAGGAVFTGYSIDFKGGAVSVSRTVIPK